MESTLKKNFYMVKFFVRAILMFEIGEGSNIQDNSVIHLENDQGVIVGND
ncbi:hypothetical protein Ct9H90mP29_22150 [bacterium]|nr:MAG: hypothetical protein Ct9H90mP29_22150 [bacterium]